MSNVIKVNTAFGELDEGTLSDDSQKIINNLTANATLFAGIPLDATAIAALRTTFNDKRLANYYPGQAAEVGEARSSLETALSKDGNWLNSNFGGDEGALRKSGFPLHKANEAQGTLPQTTLKMIPVSNARQLDYKISNLKIRDVHYGIMYTEASNTDTNPANWKFHYAAGRKGTIKGRKSKVDYKFVSFGMGTEAQLVYSEPVTLSAQ